VPEPPSEPVKCLDDMIDSILSSSDEEPARSSPIKSKFAGKSLLPPQVEKVEKVVDDDDDDEFGLDAMLEDSDDDAMVATPPVTETMIESSKPLSLSMLGTADDDSGSGSGSSDSE
jgi:hypothetical protein